MLNVDCVGSIYDYFLFVDSYCLKVNGKLNERKKIDEDIGMRYQSFIGYINF